MFWRRTLASFFAATLLWSSAKAGQVNPPGLVASGVLTQSHCVSVAGQGSLQDNGACSQGAFPNNENWTIEGSSLSKAFNAQGDVYISASSPGSGYTGTGTATVTVATGSCTTPPTVNVTLNPSGGLQFALTYVGQGCIGATFSVAISGFSTGSGASVSLIAYPNPYAHPWWYYLFNGPVLGGKVASSTNYSVSGSTVIDVYNRMVSNNYAGICGTAGHSQFFLLDGGVGGNSITGNSGESENAITYDVAYAQWLAITHTLKAAGCTVVVTTATPRQANLNGLTQATYNSQIAQFNTLVLNGIPGVDYDYVIDVYDEIPNPLAYPFASDTTHYTAQGHQFVGNLANVDLATGNGGDLNSLATQMQVGQFLSGLQVGGNILSANYTANSLVIGYSASTQYIQSNGPSSGNRNGITIRGVDNLGMSAKNALVEDASGNITLGNGGTLNFPSLSASTAADVLCYAVSTGAVTYETTGTTCAVSAKRFKRDIHPISSWGSLRETLAFQPVAYRYKPGIDDGGAEVHYGLVAEDVQKVAPQLVAYEKDGKTLHGVKYGELSPYLIGAIKAQQDEIEGLFLAVLLLAAWNVWLTFRRPRH